MRLVEAKFVNFVHLGNIEFKSDEEIIVFLGKNGSGKSTLLLALNPDPSSDRYITTYPAIKGLHAYKRLLYKNHDVFYEIMVEYVPKKNSHSAKCYFNIIENGVKKELNPTGHVDFYKDLVNKHLNFNPSVSEVAYIYLNNNGLVTATPKRREEIAKSTIDVKLLKTMQKNAIDEAKESKAMKQVLSTLISKNASEIGSIEKAKERLNEIENLLEEELKNQSRLQTDKINEELNLSNLKNDRNNIDIHEVKNIIDSINSMYSILDIKVNSYNEIIDFVKDVESNYNDGIRELQSVNDKINNLESVIESNNYIIRLEDEYKENIRRRDSILKEIKNTFKPNDINTILDTLRRIAKLVEETTDIDTSNLEFSNIDNYIKEKENEIESINKFMREFERREETIKSMKINVTEFKPISSDCNRCPLYDNIVISNNFVLANRDKYYDNENLLLELTERLDKTKDILRISSEIESLNKSIYINGRFRDDIIKDILDSNINFTLDRLESYIADTENLIELNNSIETTSKIIENRPKINIDFNEINVLKIEHELKLNSIDYLQRRRQAIINNLGNIDSIINFKSELSNMSLNELKGIMDRFNNFSKIKEKHLYIIERLERELSSSQERFRSLSNEKAHLEKAIKEYSDASDQLETVNKSFEFYNRSRDLLLKRIPISLLENNLLFMERITNRILSENNINIQIKIEASANEIHIPYTVNDSPVSDVRLCSQGETCLLSLLLNACMVHITGYGIMYIDEIDANLDEINRKKFNNIIYSILNLLNINQIFGISHNISSNISSAKKFGLGDISGLSVDESEVEFIK